MQLYSRAARRMQASCAFAIVLAIALAAVLTAGVGTASAYVYPNQINHVYMNLAEAGSYSQRDQYSALIGSLRRAAADGPGTYRGSTYTTQDNDYGLIRLSLHRNLTGEEVSLWIDPVNLYIVGFSNRYLETWAFNDARINLGDRLARSGFQVNGYVRTLPFGGSYGSLTASSGNTRWNMGHNYADLLGSLSQLANVRNPTGGQANGSPQQWTARSLLFMINFASEAARFWDIEGVFRATTVGRWTDPGLNAYQQELENGWEEASRYGQQVTNNPSTPGTVVSYNPYLSYNSWADVAARLAMMLTLTSFVPDKGANWWRDQV